MVELILFLISLFVMVVLVLLRYFEIKLRKNLIPASFRNACDVLVIKVGKYINRKRIQFWNLLISVRKYITHLLSHAVVHTWEFLVKKSAKYVNMVRGRGILKTKKGASIFQDLKEDRIK